MVELESEGELSRNQVAAFLHEFADELEVGAGERRAADREGTATASGSSDADAIGDRRDESPIEGIEDDSDDTREGREVEASRHRTDSGEVVEHTGSRERITLIVGGDSATVSVPERFDFDVEVESRSPMLSSGVHQGIEFDLSWKIENPDQVDEEEWLEVE